MKPHVIQDKDLHGRLTAVVKRTIDDTKEDAPPAMVYGIIRAAAAFFAHCPEDFCIQSADWYEGHAVFGGTNRLLWSVEYGFRPDPSYCSPKFKEQFTGDYWESFGELLCDGMEIWLVSSHHLEHVGILPKLRIPLAWGGTHRVLGRKSNKGDGKWAEIRLHTGFEA